MQVTTPEIIIYSRPGCSYCTVTRLLLDRKNLSYTELNVRAHPELETEMLARTGGQDSLPQIFIGDRLIGGFEQLYELEIAGRLDALLGR